MVIAYLRDVPDISIQNLTLDYRQHLLFDQFNLHLPARSWTALLGPSGVGKSTLLKLLAGLPTGVDHPIPPEAITTSDHQTLFRRVAYMAQQDLLMPWLNVLENCLVGYRLRGQPITKVEYERAENLLTQVGLGHTMTWRISQLSGGMRQRVALVRTLLEERPVVLMDEPFSALDVLTRLQLQDLAAGYLTHKTVLLVTHDPLEALRLADRIYVLRGSPVQVSELLILNTSRPRSLQDPILLERQGQLLALLTAIPSPSSEKAKVREW